MIHQPGQRGGGQQVNKKDLILITVLLAAAGILAVFFFLKPDPSGPVRAAVARVDGKIIGIWDLETDHEEDIKTVYGYNHLSVRNGAVRITEADCPDSLCVYQGEISEKDGIIVCLPHHLVVEIAGDEKNAGSGPGGSRDTIDAMTG